MSDPSLPGGAIPAPENSDPHLAADPLPLRMLNEFAYCPRLFHLMHVEGRWEDNHYTAEGRHVHRRVDKLDHILPEAGSEADKADHPGKLPGGDEPPTVTRSVPLASATLGLTAKLDLVASVGDEAVPVETKRGRVPNNPERSWEPERVQLMAQGLLLREHGYTTDHGVLYFAGSRTRVDVPFTDQLEQRTRQLLADAHAASQSTTLPPPLEDSPKCRGCSLNGICLPDETLALQHLTTLDPPAASQNVSSNEPKLPGAPRRLYPARPHAVPLYVQEPGAYVGKSKSRLVVRKDSQTLSEARLKDISQLVLCGNIGVSAQTLHLLCEAGVPVVHLSMGHWFYGITQGINLRNAFDRAAQFNAAADPQRRLDFARQLVADKAANQRTLLRRNAPSDLQLDRVIRDLDDLTARLPQVQSLDAMLGTEGALAAVYFQHFNTLLKPRDLDAQWDFKHRNRRPPKDPVNAALSFGYALLAKECTVALLAEGLDPWWGLYHQPRHGRPALALDLMEPFRPAVVDSAVVTAFNTGMLQRRNFTTNANACMLQPAGRKNLIRAYEARLDQLITHPVFDYRCSWRTVIKLQARLLARWLRSDIPTYTTVTTR
ncbi:MAG: CRISPR-associated endonuclease Cas1 [Planctomycetota bacterium]